MLLEKLRNNYRNKKSLAMAVAFVVMISMLTMGAIYDKESKTVTLIQRDCFNDIENQREIVTRKTTVEEFLAEQEIILGEDDVLNAGLSDEIYPEQVVTVEKSRIVEIHADGKIEIKKAVRKTVEEVLKNAGIILSETDIVSPGRTEPITENMVITVDRVDITEETVNYEIPYESVKEADSSRYMGETAVKQYGTPGQKQEIYKVTKVNGTETARELISSSVTAEPVNEIILTGTKQNPSVISKKQSIVNGNNQFNNSRDEIAAASSQTGKGFSYSRVLNVTATAYDPSPSTNAGYTKTAYGLTPQYGVVAVDPNVIPLGTRLYIESSDGGASWVYGYCIAGDTGGAIKGNKVDLCYNTKAECIQFGRRSATVYILD